MAHTTKKNKIQKTNRIRLKNATIYTSCEVVRNVRSHLLRSGMILIPLKGQYDDLMVDLRKLVNEKPDHFPESSKIIIQSLGGGI